MPGKLKQISVGSSSVVWGVNRDDKIYRWTGATWQQISGGLKYICVSRTGSNIWGVNKNNEIYYRSRNTWVKVSGRLKQIDCR